MTTADVSVHTTTRRPTVADLVGPDMLMEELTWEVRGKLLRCALSRTHRAMQLNSVEDEPDPPAEDPRPSDGIPYGMH